MGSGHERWMRIALEEAAAAEREGNIAVVGVRFADMGVSHGGYAIERLIELTDQLLQVEAGPFRDECAALRLRTTPR